MSERERFDGHAKAHGLFFQGLIELNRCKTIVEIGVAHASTTKYLTQGAESVGGFVNGFDMWAPHGISNHYDQISSREKCDDYLKSQGLKSYSLTQINTASPDFVARLDELGPIDFAFIDGCHSYEGVRRDFDLVYPRLNTPGIIAFHDTLRIDGCRRMIMDLRTTLNDGTFDIVNFPFGNRERRVGISLLVKRTWPVLGIPIDERCDPPAGYEQRVQKLYQDEKTWFNKQLGKQ